MVTRSQRKVSCSTPELPPQEKRGRHGGEAGEGYGERVRGRRAETPTSVQIGNTMEVTGKVGKVGWSVTIEAAVHQHCQFELDPLTNPEPVKIV